MSDDRDDLIATVAAELRRPVPISAGFDARVMAAVRATRHEGRLRTALRWIAEPRPVRISPVGAFAAAAGLAGLILASSHVLEEPVPATAPVAAAAAPVPAGAPQTVQFVLAAPGASAVSLVGDFNDWNPDAMPLRPVANGEVWSVTVPLTPGRHEYAFVVDGTRWVPDPTAPQAPDADFGVPNSVVTVAASL